MIIIAGPNGVGKTTFAMDYLKIDPRLYLGADLIAIELIYLFVDSPDLCNKRIEERVLNGGHFISPEDVARRFYRSYKNFWKDYRFLVESWSLYYNFNREFEVVASGKHNAFDILSRDLFKQFEKIKVDHE